MPKCKNDVFIAKVGISKITKSMEVDFDVFRRMPDCNRISAHNYAETSATSVRWDKWAVPKDAFECDKKECVNSGTQYFTGTSPVTVEYDIPGDATEWAAGIIVFYGKNMTATPTVTLGDDTNNSTFTAVKGEGDVYTVDLSQTPASTQGTGWVAEAGLTKMIITVAQATEFGLSSIAIFNEALDFATREAVKIACLTGIDGSWDFDIAEETCFNPARYDADAITSIERTVTGTAVTANYMFLNPMIGRGKEATSFDMETVERKIEAASGDDPAQVKLYDMDKNQCGRVAVYIDGVCAPHEGLLTQISNPALALEENQFALVEGADAVSVVFNQAHGNRTAIISYPKVVNVEAFDLCADNLDGVRARMTYVKCHTDGVKYRFVYDNVLITSFPDGVTNDGEQEFSFTVTILKGEDGCFGHVYRILD